MEAHLQMMIQDPRFSPVDVDKAKLRIEGYVAHGEEWGDGPSNARAEVVDMDGITGEIQPGATFVAPARAGGPATYQLRAKGGAAFVPPTWSGGWGRRGVPQRTDIDIDSSEFNQVSVMATVLKTIQLYEKEDVLGRPVEWAFGDPKIMVVPRIWYDENAGYSRYQQRLEFGYFTSHLVPAGPEAMPATVYTSLSRDVVAHETGHAILDGIAPQLIEPGTSTHQSFALHEAIADVTGLLIAISSRELRLDVLATTGGNIDNTTYFSSIGEQFGMEKEEPGPALRDLCNLKKMGEVDSCKPHDLSQVLTGALFALMARIYARRWTAYATRLPEHKDKISASGRALWDSAEQLKRMALRALDYLPPGPILFADYARAVIASDAASPPKDTEECGWLKEELVTRAIVPHAEVLAPKTPDIGPDEFEPETLYKDEAAVRALVEQHGSRLGIPDGVTIEVRPRLKVTRRDFHRGGKYEDRTECVLKVAWSDPGRPELRGGTTLAIDWATKRPTIWLSTQPDELRAAGPAPDPGASLALQARLS